MEKELMALSEQAEKQRKIAEAKPVRPRSLKQRKITANVR